jgi:hypothetical protein
MAIIRRLMKWGAVPTLAGIAVASIIAIGGAGSSGTEASSHREAPLISADPQADATDTYVFIAPDSKDKVTFVGNWIPLEEPAGGPNFYNFGDDVSYEFAIDNDGDSKEDIVYQFHFTTEIQDPSTFLYATGPITALNDSNYNIRQFYDIVRTEKGKGPKTIATHLPVPPNNIGPTSTPNYDSLASAAVFDLPGGGKVFAGQRDDPFFVDLGAVFDLATIRQLPGNAGNGIDNVAGFNTNSIVFQVPIADVTDCKCDPSMAGGGASAGAHVDSSRTATTKTVTKTASRTPEATPTTTAPPPNGIIGVWTDTYRHRVRVLNDDGESDSHGKKVKVSRLGNPLVNEVVIPLAKKDAFNASDPKDDAQFLPFVLNSDLASKLNAVYGLGLPTAARTDLATVFLTGIPGLNQPAGVKGSEELRINLAIKPDNAMCGTKRLGVLAGDICGFPNGRRLADDVTDIELRAVACGYGFDFGPCSHSAGYAPTTEQLGDGVDRNDKDFLQHFPYVASPYSGFNSPHNTTPVPPVIAGLGAAAIVLGLLVSGTFVVSRIRRRRSATVLDA